MLAMLAEIIWNEDTIGPICACAVPIAAIVGGYWYYLEKGRSINDLKRSMVERGMSVDDIERVLKAKAED
jgi:hypothetical protein